MQEHSPVNALPPLILAGFIAIIAVEGVLSLGAAGVVGGPQAVGWRIGLIERLGFSPRVLELLWHGRGGADLALRLISYPLVHGSFTHAAFAGAIWLALGKFVGDVFRPLAVAAIALAGIVIGALAFGLYGLATGGNAALFGAYPAVYALIGAYTYLMWLQLGQMGENQLRAFALIGTLVGLQLVFGLLFGADPSWSADLAAFLAGGLTATLVAPGGWRALLARIRRR